jgi:phosphoribosyl 1,2-cyclic phosphodiesterase
MQAPFLVVIIFSTHPHHDRSGGCGILIRKEGTIWSYRASLQLASSTGFEGHRFELQ